MLHKLNFKILFCAVFVFSAAVSCKKSNSNTDENSGNGLFHIDNVITQDVNSNVLSFSRKMDKNNEFCVVSATENSVFRIASIDNNGGSETINIYKADSSAVYQERAVSAVADKGGNIWINGQLNKKNLPTPFVVKLDENGEVLMSKCFINPVYIYRNEVIVSHKILTLKNNDILCLFGSRDYPHLYLVRMNNEGTVQWAKKFAINKADIIGNDLAEAANGDILFSSRVDFKDKIYTATTACTSTGSVKYCKGFNFSFENYGAQLKVMQSGEVLLMGNPFGGDKPFLMRMNADNGTLLLAKQAFSKSGRWVTLLINEVTKVDDVYKAVFCNENELDLITLNDDFKIISSTKTLARQHGFRNANMVVDNDAKQLFYLINTPGPSGGSGFQFLNSEFDGKSCQTYENPAITFRWESFKPSVLNFNMEVSDAQFTEIDVKWNMAKSIFTSANACGL